MTQLATVYASALTVLATYPPADITIEQIRGLLGNERPARLPFDQIGMTETASRLTGAEK